MQDLKFQRTYCLPSSNIIGVQFIQETRMSSVENIDLVPDVVSKINTPEAKAARRRVWLRAMTGELVCSFVFFVCVMASSLNFSGMGPAGSSPISQTIAGALSSAFAAISVV
jgi:hypothetical protein